MKSVVKQTWDCYFCLISPIYCPSISCCLNFAWLIDPCVRKLCIAKFRIFFFGSATFPFHVFMSGFKFLFCPRIVRGGYTRQLSVALGRKSFPLLLLQRALCAFFLKQIKCEKENPFVLATRACFCMAWRLKLLLFVLTCPDLGLRHAATVAAFSLKGEFYCSRM